MKITAKTDIGLGRRENQDDYRAGVLSDDIMWAVVCDGMGGANGGAVASRLAADALEESLTKAEYDEKHVLSEIQEAAIQKANQVIFDCARTTPSMAGMGTTVVSAIIKKEVLYLSHVGDSRAYLYRNGRLEQLTRDHSKVQALLERGSITEEEAYSHPEKNLITRALGVLSQVTTESIAIYLKPKDIILLCSDGLSNYVTMEQISDILKNKPFFETAQYLIQAALQARGRDNITALLIEVGAEEQHG